MEIKTKDFFSVLLILLILTTGYTFYKTMIQEDYLVIIPDEE
jgi:hypothetical protein